MKIALFRTSNKENERRLPIHPGHLELLPSPIWKYLYLERNYGIDFGFSDSDLSKYCNSFLKREELFEECNIILLPKPTEHDIESMTSGQILWGWAHCIQQINITQKAIEKKITIVAWESMHHWDTNGKKNMHIFYKNNELAGYSAILHTLELLGIDGHYGPRQKVSLIGYGSVSKGAIFALRGRGFNNLHVFTRRPLHFVADQNPDVYYYHLDKSDLQFYATPPLGKARRLIEELDESDIIINGVLQDPIDPDIFVTNSDLDQLKKNSVIVDISCDKGMGFEFADPTTFNDPIISLKNGIKYYSVDHTPSYLWNAATREISKALVPFLLELTLNNFDFHKQEILNKAIEIENGLIINKNILTFQKRTDIYPHLVIAE